MKDVTIISKVVGRKEGDRPVTGGGSQTAVDLSAYLLKKTWDTAWELREKDGVPYLFGKLPVVLQSGLTSYVADEAVDLPGIYDGLPIDNQTLYWEVVTEEVGTDEEGNPIYETAKVLRSAGGGGGTGGGSVLLPLSWSGFSNGSWNGSEAKTIVIPSKLSELDNDGKFFEDGGWIGSDANSVIFGSYLYGGISNNTPRNVGQLLAFNNGDTASWNRGSQIFIEGENFYYRQFWDNYWRNWRRVISGDSNGVIDYDLTLGGSLNMPSGYSQIKCGENALLVSYGGSTDTYLYGNEHLYLMSKNIFAYEGSEEIYRILHEGNYRNYEYRAKWLSVVDTRNTTPKPSDIETFAVTAQFTNTDNPGDGWFSGLSIQGWTNDYKAWQLRSGAWSFASDHLYFRNGELETWNDWRRVITGDVDGVLDSNLEVKGEEGGNIKFVINPDRSIGNGMYELASIRHALRFPWYDDAYEIGTVRSNSADAWGFGVTYQNNQLVWRVDRERMDVYGDLIVKGIVDSVTITSLQEQLNGLWKRNWFEDLSATMIMADNASFERLYGDSIIIGDCKLSYDYEKKTLVIQKFDGTDTNVVISGGLTTYSTNV